MKTWQKPFVFMLACITLLISTAPVSARPAGDRYLLRADDWLAGKGVDVIYPDLGPTGGEGFIEITPFCGYAYCYQCIELTIRLYAEKLGYLSNNGRWPDIVNIPNDMIEVIQKAHDIQAQIKDGSLGVDDPEAAKYLPFVDLTFIPNGGTIPPRPGDMIIYSYRKPGDHIMVVNRVGGNKVQIVQQNIWTQTRPATPIPERLLELQENAGHFSINNAEGWIHSPRMKALINPTSNKGIYDPKVGNGSWRWDEEALSINLDRAAVNSLASKNGNASADLLTDLLNTGGAFETTSDTYARCAMQNVAATLSSDIRFTSSFGLKGLDIRIQFSGDTLRLRPAGGKFDGQWITISGARCGWEGNPL
jgi:hypothetical protein